jgi:hypothetical protein
MDSASDEAGKTNSNEWAQGEDLGAYEWNWMDLTGKK